MPAQVHRLTREDARRIAVRAQFLDADRPTDLDVVEVVRWRRGIPQYEVGHLARMKRIDEAMAAVPGVTLSGNAYRGVGVNDCVREAERLVPELVAAVEKNAA